MKARVRGGRLVLDEPTELPDGTEVEVVAVAANDMLDDDERAALHAALEEGGSQADAGETIDAAEVLQRLRDRRL